MYLLFDPVLASSHSKGINQIQRWSQDGSFASHILSNSFWAMRTRLREVVEMTSISMETSTHGPSLENCVRISVSNPSTLGTDKLHA